MVEKLIANHGVDVEWMPFYLRPDTPPEGMELPAYLRERAAEVNERLRQMARENGMEMTPLKRILNTRRAHEATEYARVHGKHQDFHRVVFRQVYAEGKDISQWDVLRAAAEEVELNADEMQAEVDAEKYTATVQTLVYEAYALGITGVPTYVLNDRYAIVGARPYSVFQQVMARMADESKGDVKPDEEI